jgi:hypothetical protein
MTMNQDRPYWNAEVEPKFNTAEMHRLQEPYNFRHQ